MDQKLAQILVPSLADAKQPRSATRGDLPWYQSQPGCKVATPCKGSCIPHCRGEGCCVQHPNTGDRCQATRAIVGPSMKGKLVIIGLDTPIELDPRKSATSERILALIAPLSALPPSRSTVIASSSLWRP